jgi:hypothetical protein
MLWRILTAGETSVICCCGDVFSDGLFSLNRFAETVQVQGRFAWSTGMTPTGWLSSPE